MPSSALNERVGLGLLGLQEYAHEYWLFHVLRYFEISTGPVDQKSPLLTQLSRFMAKHTNLLARAQLNALPGPSSSTNSPFQDNIPEKLQVAPELRSLICQILDFRHNFDAKQASEGPGKSRNVASQEAVLIVTTYADILATDWDPTLLSRANWRYNNVVKSLVCASSWVGLSPAELQTFQSEYRRTAFICTVRNCERSRFGYASVIELEDHKTRQHATGFKCYHQNCRYNDAGFTSSTSLRAHVRRFHLRDLPEIPKTLKRKYPEDGPPKDARAIEASSPVPQGSQEPDDQQPLFDADKQKTDFSQYAFQFIQNTPYLSSGWRASVEIAERVNKTRAL